MSASTITLEPTADQSVELNQRLTRGGSVCTRLETVNPGTYWLAPRDSRRRYMGFSAQAGGSVATVTPGDNNAPAGFWVAPGADPVEFGGPSQLPLIQDEWWVTFTAAGSLDMVIYRDT